MGLLESKSLFKSFLIPTHPPHYSFHDRNARQREEAINVVIKTMLTFPLHELNIGAILENLASMLTDPRQKVLRVILGDNG